LVVGAHGIILCFFIQRLSISATPFDQIYSRLHALNKDKQRGNIFCLRISLLGAEVNNFACLYSISKQSALGETWTRKNQKKNNLPLKHRIFAFVN